MRNIAKIVTVMVACGLVAGSIVFVTKDDENASSNVTASNSVLENSESTANQFSDQEILSGLLYGAGEFAEALGMTISADEYEIAGESFDYESVVQASVAEIEELFSAEVSAAITNIRSNDPLQVEEGMEQLEEVMENYEDYYETDTADTPTPLISPCGVGIVCWAYAALAVHNTVAVTALTVGVAGFWLWGGATTWWGSTSFTTMDREVLVVDIMEVLQ